MFYPAGQWISVLHPSSVVHYTIPSALHNAAWPVPSKLSGSFICSLIHSFIHSSLVHQICIKNIGLTSKTLHLNYLEQTEQSSDSEAFSTHWELYFRKT